MDLGLPGMDGIQATEKVKQHDRDLKVIILTSHNDSQEVLNSFESRSECLLFKRN